MHLNAVACHDFGCYSSENRAVVAGIVRNGNGSTARLGFEHVVGQALGRLGDRVGIHPVGARPHQAPQSPRAKLQVGIKGFHQCFTPFFQQRTHLTLGGFVVGGLGPIVRTLCGKIHQFFSFHAHSNGRLSTFYFMP